ncbi:uncharacterized protein LOC133179255 [Saccostrea echinata]|uniref:uncharacterized protein LOC133179255 n=1 Tax=Saccostrea echinata TaxID=191078 RepID=UPI002A80A91D|nr:uncharacterized protein LOC133179255 [Saccostrea echinata]
MYARINNLKRKNPKLKTLLAIGGWTEGNAPISTMASTNESRDEFVSTTIQYLRTRGFDGLDLDWEYPGSRGGPPEDKENLIHLLKKLKSEFTKEARETGREPLLLAIAVPVGEERINSGYNIPEVNRYVDFINLMAYDFHGAWEAQTGHHSPLFKGKAERWYAAQLNVQWSAAYWRRNGASRNKMVIGMAMYGRGYKLQYLSINGIGAQALVGSSGNSMGPFTKSKGLLAYYEICSRLNGNGVEIWDDERRVPYMYDGSDWVGYENVRSVIEKTKWTMDHGYAGVMIWALDQDDFTGHFCKAGKYPLLSAINKTLRDYTPRLLSKSQHNVDGIADDLLKYEGTTKRIVDSTSFSLTGLTSKQVQERNNIIDTTTKAATTTYIPTTTNILTTHIPTAYIPTTHIPTTHIPTTMLSSTTTAKAATEETPTPKTSTETTSSTITATPEIGNRYNSNIESISTMVLDSNQATVNSNNTLNQSMGDSSFNSSISNDVELALDLTLENKTTEGLDIAENITVTIPNSTDIFQDNARMETSTSPIVRSNRMIMSLVAPSEVYYSTDIVHKGRTLLQVDRGTNDQQGNTGSGSSGFTSVLNSLFSVLSEFGGFRGGGRRSSNQRNSNGDSSGQRNADSPRQRNTDSARSRNIDSSRQRSGEPQRQRNVDTVSMRNRDIPAQRVNADLQRVRNRLPTGSRNVDSTRQENIDPSRQRLVTRPRSIEPVENVQRNGDQTLRRTGDVLRRRTDDSVLQRNEIRRRNNEMVRQRNNNGEILRQRNANGDLLRQRNGNADLLRQRNNDLTQQQSVQRNVDVIRQRNNAALNPRAAETLRQRIPEIQRRALQRTSGQMPNRITPQSGGRNTVNPQFNLFQNVEMATIPQNVGPSSAQRGRLPSNSIPSLDFLETLAQGSPQIRDSIRLNGRGRETNGRLNRNPTRIASGVPDISALTDMFMAQDPQNQLLQQETVQTSITEAMLSSDFMNRANGIGGMRRSASDNLRPADIFGNRTITPNTQATQTQQSLFNEIRNRQPSLNSNSIDTIDLSFLESQVEEGFARDRAQEIERSMLSPGMLANGLIPNGMNGIFPQTRFQGLSGQFLPQQGLGRNSLIPRASQFQQTSMQVPETNQNTSMAVIPFNNLDRTLQQVVSTGPTFRLRNQTASLGSILQNNVDQVPFTRNSQQALRPRGMTNQNIVNRLPQQDNNRNRLLTSQTGLPGPLQFTRIQDGTRPIRNMLGPLGPIQRSRNIPSLTNTFISSAMRGIPSRGGPLIQANTNNNQMSPNSLFFPMNPVTVHASTIGSPGPPPLSSSAIQTPEEVIQRTNTIGSRSVFSQRTNTTVNIDGSMLKAEPVIPKSEILWKWEV